MAKIQKPTKEDIKGIQDVFYKTWLATYSNEEAGITAKDIEEKFKDRFSEGALEKRLADVLDDSKDHLFVIAKDDNDVVGVCKARKAEECNELQVIYVLPSYQGRGIGTGLWERVVFFFGNERDIVVHVAVYNIQAINFYKKLGFVDTGKRFSEKKLKMPISGSYILEMELVIRAVKNQK